MKKNLRSWYQHIMLMLLGLVTAMSARANHVAGIQMYYTNTGGLNYTLTMIIIGDCGNTSINSLHSASPRVCLYNNTTLNQTLNLTFIDSAEITPVCTGTITKCTSLSSTIPGYRQYRYTTNVTLPTTSSLWRFIFQGYMGASSAGRSTAIVNIASPGSSLIQMIDTLNNTGAVNNNARSTAAFTPFFCQNNTDNYNPAVTDADGDSLVFALIAGKVGVGGTTCATTTSNVTYNSGYSAAAPLGTGTSSWTFNTTNGQIDFVPTVANTYMVDYNVREFRGGTFVGNSMFESNFVIQTCTTSPPMGNISTASQGTIVDSTHYSICAGNGAFTLHLLAGSADPLLNIKMSASGLPAGAAFSVINDSTPHPDGTFTWNSTTATPGTYTFYLNYRDDQCPVNGTNTQAFTITIQQMPGAITGSATVCTGSTTTLGNTLAGGTWSSDNAAVASINSSTGVLAGISAGTANVTYAVGTAGCLATTIVTVLPVPNAITGTLNVCVGAATTLSSSSSGGTWISSNTAVATIGSASGVASGISAGTSNITYRFTGTGCQTTAILTVNALPTAISGATTVCTGSTVTLTGTPTGGTWVSSNVAIATIGAANGVVTGITGGTAILTYTNGSGCFILRTETVNITPTINPTTAITICVGNSTSLTGSTGGGVWSSSNTVIGTVGIASGIVQSISPGTTTISYTLSGCTGTKVVTVAPAPGTITPAAPTVCVGSNLTLSNTVAGGTWTSGATAVATIGSSNGVATGVAAGNAAITYAIGTCTVSSTLTVNATPTINPATATSLCVDDVTTLTATIGGGVWTSSTAAVATVSSGGVVTATGTGTATITYTIPATGCFSTKIITVNTTPSAISPASSSVCVGSNITLSNTVAGGVWTSGNTAIATAGSATGIVTGVSAGNVNITYAVGTCTVTSAVTVNPLPSAFTPGALCAGTTTTLASTPATGTWTSSDITVASIGSTTGILSAIATGTANITYTLPTTCSQVSTVTVNTAPAAITPAGTAICAGATATLSNTVTGGIWSSSNTAIATVSSTGIVTGTGAGNADITYVVGSCTTAVTVTINALPAAIAPSAPAVCAGSTITLSNSTTGGTWSSGNVAVASVGSATGVLTGTATGTSIITYTTAAGCSTTAIATVNAVPFAGTASGPSVICQGSTGSYSSTATGGVWSTATGNASIATTGVATGITPGTDIISYAVANGCGTAVATVPVTVNVAPTAGTLTAPSFVCVGSSAGITSTVAGGVWSVSNTNGTITSGGLFTGTGAGTTTISYTVTNSCGTATATAVVTVNPLGSAGTVSGPATVCVSGLISLTSTVAGGVWSSSNTNATVGSTSGIVTGVLPGIDTISYTVSGACGSGAATYIVTIQSLPSAGTLSGASSVCVASSITLSSTVAGGTWSAGNTNVSVGGATGIVTGAAAGTVVMTYTYNSPCGTAVATKILTVNPMPLAGTLSGADSVCTGASITLSTTVAGGTWLAGNFNASVSSGGIVTGFTAGTTPITYTYTNVCGADFTVKIVQVVAPPVAGTLSGPSMVCTGAGITLVSSVAGGIWTATNANASIAGPGIVLGNTAGIDTIVYTVTNMCGSAQATRIINVNLTPTVSAITGPTTHCVGSSITLNNATSGGNWTSSNMAIATVGLSTGVVTGISAGVVSITYTINTAGCPGTAIAADTVLAIPSPGSVAGPGTVCIGSSVSLSSTTTGGVWSSSDVTVATVDATGNVTGITAGTATITYTVTNVCGTTAVTHAVTVNTLPTVLPVSGLTSVCVNANMTLTSATPGGVWSSSNVAVATVGSGTGVVNGVSAGNVIISYTVTNALGCSASATYAVTVNALPVVAPVTGPTSICAGGTATLTSATVGGSWFSGAPAVAGIGASSGIVTGMGAGTVNIFYAYTDAFGCTTMLSRLDTVISAPAVGAITGTADVCLNSTVTLASTTAGGLWSTASANATVGTAGDVTGIAAGTATISYSVTSAAGCVGVATRIVTVHALPTVAAITGTGMECAGATTTLANATAGGTWSSGATATATVGTASGVVTGLVAGTAIITYTITDAFGCAGSATIVNTVNALPVVAAITGVANECIGSTTMLASATPGGVWSSSSTAIATVAGGTVTGLAAGTAIITYAVTDALGCTGIATIVNTVSTTPAATAITGTLSVCVNAVTTLSNSTPGGSWTSGSTSIATIGAVTGDVTGIAAGTVAVSYTVTNACGSVVNTATLTVNALPAAGIITSPFATLCAGAAGSMTATVPGGTWTSSTPSVATINLSTGMVTGIGAGTTNITYTVTNASGCKATATFVLAVAPGLGTLAVLPTPGATFCDSTSVYMFVTPPAPGLTYQWRVAGVDIAGATNDNYTATVTGNYSVIVGNGLCSQILSGPNVVNAPAPVIGFNAPAQLFTGSFAGYQWYLNGVAIPGATNAVVNITTDGSYTVKVTDVNGCSVMSQPYVMSTLGITSPGTGDITVYPNPATSTVYINANVAVNVSLLSVDGKVLGHKNNATMLDVSKLPAGLYMVMVYDHDNNLLKMVKFAKAD